jgi:hypothetical protein
MELKASWLVVVEVVKNLETWEVYLPLPLQKLPMPRGLDYADAFLTGVNLRNSADLAVQ